MQYVWRLAAFAACTVCYTHAAGGYCNAGVNFFNAVISGAPHDAVAQYQSETEQAQYQADRRAEEKQRAEFLADIHTQYVAKRNQGPSSFSHVSGFNPCLLSTYNTSLAIRALHMLHCGH